MNKLHRALSTSLLGIAVTAALYGCGGPDATPTKVPTNTVEATATALPPTETPLPPSPTVVPATPTTQAGPQVSGPAGDLLRKSALVMRDVKSYHFTMDTTVSTTGGGTAVQGEGDAVLPDKRRLSLTLGPGGPTEMILLGNDMFFKMPGQDGYMSLGGPGNPLGSMATGATAQNPATIIEIAQSGDIVDDETINGVNTTHVTLTYDADQAIKMVDPSAVQTPTAAGLGKTKADVWIDKATSYVTRMQFHTAMPDLGLGGSATPTTASNSAVTLTFSKYNETVNPPIEKPANITSLPGGAPMGGAASGTPTP